MRWLALILMRSHDENNYESLDESAEAPHFLRDAESAMCFAEALADLHAENYGVARDLPLPYLTAMETF